MGKDISKLNYLLHFCDGGSCRKAGSEQVVRDARAYLKNAGAWITVHTIKTRCNGRCEDAPTMIVQPGNFWYKNLDPEKVITTIQSHLQKGVPAEKYLLFQPGWKKVLSEKERVQEPAGFKPVKDAASGVFMLAKMGTSEQVLYPLLQFLFRNFNHIEIQLPEGLPLQLNCAPLVEYSDTFDIWVKGPGLDISLAIAPIPADAPADLVERKVGIAELIVVREFESPEEDSPVDSAPGRIGPFTYSGKKGLRLKNRKGKELLHIWFKDGENIIWNHILKNYLELKASETFKTEYEQN